jgi:hypothetical protein
MVFFLQELSESSSSNDSDSDEADLFEDSGSEYLPSASGSSSDDEYYSKGRKE